MGMIVDVIFAVAEIAVAAGTIAELQLRVGGIRFAANRTAVCVGRRGIFLSLKGYSSCLA